MHIERFKKTRSNGGATENNNKNAFLTLPYKRCQFSTLKETTAERDPTKGLFQ